MGKEGGKPAWPKPSRKYQTITGRRYGRRYAYVHFTPSLNRQVRDEHQHNEDFKLLEVEDTSKANSSREPSLENTGTGEPVCGRVSCHTLEASASPFSLFSCGLEGNQVSGNLMNPYKNFEGLAEYAAAGCNEWNGQDGIAFVNMDSYKTDDGAEEDHAQDKFSLGTEEAVVFEEAKNEIYSEFEKGRESFTDLDSQLSSLIHSVTRECCEEAGPMSLVGCFCIDSGLACPNSRTSRTPDEDQAVLQSNPSDAVHEVWQIKCIENVGIQNSTATANELNVSDDQGNSLELVVRPRIRKQSTSNQLKRERLPLDDEEGESSSWRRTGRYEVKQEFAECALNSKERNSSTFFGSREHEGHQKNTELRKNEAAEEEKYIWEDSAFWDGPEHFSMYHENEDSSECSDGEWCVASTWFTATEKDHSSYESCETISAREIFEPEVQSSCLNDVEEENKDYSSQGRQQMLLEEGEIPLLQCQQAENVSDVEMNAIHDFVFSGYFYLDRNYNLEVGASESEDPAADLRLGGEPADVPGLAQGASHENPVALESLENYLQEAMEAAVAHLGLLGFEIDEAHPPATKETIDSLPQIVVTNDQYGEEQSCTICCSEYVENDIITELPCHHLFHRTCVALWLQESGTCPVCRHVLEPVQAEAAAAAVPFLPDPESASSSDDVTGTKD